MPVKDRTYSFRASEELVPRTRWAVEVWAELLAASGTEVSSVREQAMRDFFLMYTRRMQELRATEVSQSALLRSLAELFVSATEKVAEDLAYLEDYRAWAREDREASSVRAGALRSAAARWRDE